MWCTSETCKTNYFFSIFVIIAVLFTFIWVQAYYRRKVVNKGKNARFLRMTLKTLSRDVAHLYNKLWKLWFVWDDDMWSHWSCVYIRHSWWRHFRKHRRKRMKNAMLIRKFGFGSRDRRWTRNCSTHSEHWPPSLRSRHWSVYTYCSCWHWLTMLLSANQWFICWY